MRAPELDYQRVVQLVRTYLCERYELRASRRPLTNFSVRVSMKLTSWGLKAPSRFLIQILVTHRE